MKQLIADGLGHGTDGARLQAKLVDDLARALSQAAQTAASIRPAPSRLDAEQREAEVAAGMPQVLKAMASRRENRWLAEQASDDRTSRQGEPVGRANARGNALSPLGLALGVGFAAIAILLGLVEVTGLRRSISLAVPAQNAAEHDLGLQSLVPTSAEVPVTRVASAAPLLDEQETVLAPVLSAMDSRLLRLSAERMAAGDIAGARSVLARAASEGSAAACFALAETFDPNQFRTARVAGGGQWHETDVVLARRFYLQALAAGDGRALRRLEALADPR